MLQLAGMMNVGLLLAEVAAHPTAFNEVFDAVQAGAWEMVYGRDWAHHVHPFTD